MNLSSMGTRIRRRQLVMWCKPLRHPLSHNIRRWEIQTYLDRRPISWDMTPCRKSSIATSFMLISCSAYSSTLKKEAKRSSETSTEFRRTTLRYIPKIGLFHNHRCDNLKSYILTELCLSKVWLLKSWRSLVCRVDWLYSVSDLP
jgi:hypothetical protein